MRVRSGGGSVTGACHLLCGLTPAAKQIMLVSIILVSSQVAPADIIVRAAAVAVTGATGLQYNDLLGTVRWANNSAKQKLVSISVTMAPADIIRRCGPRRPVVTSACRG